ncbi:hypothetical protein [Pseudoruegeria sp. SK021]|uniref:hypothetical protein n=1 Tax=Pseudoruegeria sp. SK021 TaxID=1933035 RepID=UPI000A22B070|nr:hypothetical protein [Pseudoruegeria sp. SK021]OSP55224.1 hypothetical protein BV911_08295 [Pseudoruegeria sp. SK021]
MRLMWALAAAGLVAGCSGSVPDSGSPVFLEPVSPEARAQRDVLLQGGGASSGTVGLQPSSVPSEAAVNPAAQTAGVSPAQTAGVSPVQTTTLTSTATAASTAAPSSYQVVSPKPVPSRPSGSAPSVAGYALETTHAPGTTVYQRNASSTERSDRACARYASDDLAQAAFLQTGGPAEDGQGLDPDGDGFACAWDPERFRQAIK